MHDNMGVPLQDGLQKGPGEQKKCGLILSILFRNGREAQPPAAAPRPHVMQSEVERQALHACGWNISSCCCETCTNRSHKVGRGWQKMIRGRDFSSPVQSESVSLLTGSSLICLLRLAAVC